MEAVGQLAGGVAHDFNNLLQVILGCGHLAMAETDPASPAKENLTELLAAAERARVLVGQLLAFSRRQVLQMTDLDLNASVPELMKMLRRVIGAHIELSLHPGQGLGIVRADPGQIDQMLTNLCINARDAMPDGGRITIETSDATIDEAYCDAHAGAQPGRYVRLTVADTGCGMDETTRGQAFEPFFTTKEVGKGTGLGLSTVYGLIKQHGGLVDLTSQVGRGTMFEIYLPVIEPGQAPDENVADEPRAAPRGCETVLLAEDEDMVRRLTRSILERSGYTVLAARDGAEAVEVFAQHADEVDLALLDVVMPNLGGRAVLERIRAIKPDVPVLFTTGYSVDAIHKDFVLDSGLSLIQKPYDREELLGRVRRTLDGDGRDG
jgi:CheY-like chemotaxis protein